MNWYAIIDGAGRSHVLTETQLAHKLAHNSKFTVIMHGGPYTAERLARRVLRVELTTQSRHKVIQEESED